MNVLLVSVTLLLINALAGQKLKCKNLIFCQGDLLRVVQMARIFKDSKTFVDMSLTTTVEHTLKSFDNMMTKTQGMPSKNDVVDFVQNHFQVSYNELENWFPTDYQVNPPFLRRIQDSKVRHMAKLLVSIWPTLGRKIRPEVLQSPYKYSLIPIPNGFIIPGGRFREIYYWDSYWILKGLLICDMTHTVKGMIENFFHIVENYGFIPNGGRIYYLDRSQPPLLTMMVADFMAASNDVLWLNSKIHILEIELHFWLNIKTVQFEKGGRKYRLARYHSADDTPRPESYSEDMHTASHFRTDEEKRRFFTNIRTGAETGWDFSARWFFDSQGGNRADLSTTAATRVIPVDLNAFLCNAFKLMHDFYRKLHNKKRAQFWLQLHDEWFRGIQDVLYNAEDGIWYDFDLQLKVQRNHFYPSNFAPLWTETYDSKLKETYGLNASRYLKSIGILKYEGGIPASMYETGEQWDMPNAWAPSQAMVIFGLEKTQEASAQEMAHKLAFNWMESLIKVAHDTQEMFEKYNAMFKGMYGGGGEYEVQTGFGWTNGVMLELIEYYYVIKKGDNVTLT